MSTASNRRYWRTQAERYKRERDKARTELDLCQTALNIKDKHDAFDCTADRTKLRIERDQARAERDFLLHELNLRDPMWVLDYSDDIVPVNDDDCEDQQ